MDRFENDRGLCLENKTCIAALEAGETEILIRLVYNQVCWILEMYDIHDLNVLTPESIEITGLYRRRPSMDMSQVDFMTVCCFISNGEIAI